ncbi:MAG: ABC transporter ATP-binding protein [Candidatus Latescibacterota bacterium]|jgi:putative ABC transport system ATP-binding protein
MIKVNDLKKDYRTGRVVVQALRGLDFDVAAGQFASIVGPSGCGKSTLLYILGGMLKAGSGTVEVDGFDVTAAGESALTAYRRRQIGFVFQKFNLISSLSVYDNLKIACDILSRSGGAPDRIDDVLESVGLSHKRKMKPLELSQGEQQRVAIARALVKRPKVLLADEPTGNLDSQNSENIMRLFREVSEANAQTILMITHNRGLAAATDKVIEMKDGRAIRSGGVEIAAASVEGK